GVLVFIMGASCLGDAGDGVEAIVVTCQTFSRGLSAVKRQICNDRHGRRFPSPSEVDADNVVMVGPNETRAGKFAKELCEVADIPRSSIVVPAVHVSDNE